MSSPGAQPQWHDNNNPQVGNISTQLLVTLDVSNDRVEIFKFPVLRTTETLNVVSNYNLQQFTLPALATAEVRFGPFFFGFCFGLADVQLLSF
jgi:hypothetical protein